jgi:hypothetical protein
LVAAAHVEVVGILGADDEVLGAEFAGAKAEREQAEKGEVFHAEYFRFAEKCSLWRTFLFENQWFFCRKLQDTFGAPNVVGSKKILRGFS